MSTAASRDIREGQANIERFVDNGSDARNTAGDAAAGGAPGGNQPPAMVTHGDPNDHPMVIISCGYKTKSIFGSGWS